MRKKSLVILLVLALAITTLLAGCGGGSNNGGNENEGGGDAESSLKVGFIFLHDENSTYDLNFINAATQACEDLGLEYEFKKNISEYVRGSYLRIYVVLPRSAFGLPVRDDEGHVHGIVV